MRLARFDYSTAETTLGGSTGGLSQYTSVAGGNRTFEIEKISVVFGGSTVAPNTSGGAVFVYGNSSDDPLSSIVIPTPKFGDASSAASAAALQVDLDDLKLQASWFEFRTNEASAGGVSVFAWTK